MAEKATVFGSVVIHNLPVSKTKEITLDNSVWNVGEKFKGFKKVPPGTHLIAFDCPVPKIGSYKVFRFFSIEANEIIILEFDPDKLCLKKMSKENPLFRIFSDCLDSQELDPYLGTFKVEDFTIWSQSLCWVNKFIIEKVFGSVENGAGLVGDSDCLNDDLNSKKFNFIDIELKLTARARDIISSNFAELKQLYRDRSAQLKHCINFEYNSKGFENLMGECQLAYALFMVLEDIEGLEAWQRIVYLFCESENYMITEPKNYKEFLKAFFIMLKQLPSDFFYHELTKNNFLISCLQHMMDNLQTIDTYAQYFKAFDELMLGHFKFEWREVIINPKENECHENNLLLNDEVPMIVEDNQEFISF